MINELTEEERQMLIRLAKPKYSFQDIETERNKLMSEMVVDSDESGKEFSRILIQRLRKLYQDR
jgi:hypothetical protein